MAQWVRQSKIYYNTFYPIPTEGGKCMWLSNVNSLCKLKTFILPLFCPISTLYIVCIYNPLNPTSSCFILFPQVMYKNALIFLMFLTLWPRIYYSFFSNLKHRHPSVNPSTTPCACNPFLWSTLYFYFFKPIAMTPKIYISGPQVSWTPEATLPEYLYSKRSDISD